MTAQRRGLSLKRAPRGERGGAARARQNPSAASRVPPALSQALPRALSPFASPTIAPPPSYLFIHQYKVDGVGTDQLPLFTNGDTVAGSVKVAPQPGKKVEHSGVKVRGPPRPRAPPLALSSPPQALAEGLSLARESGGGMSPSGDLCVLCERPARELLPLPPASFSLSPDRAARPDRGLLRQGKFLRLPHAREGAHAAGGDD